MRLFVLTYCDFDNESVRTSVDLYVTYVNRVSSLIRLYTYLLMPRYTDCRQHWQTHTVTQGSDCGVLCRILLVNVKEISIICRVLKQMFHLQCPISQSQSNVFAQGQVACV